ncbi:transcriptional regulator [Sneathiella chungangensis]|uniref:Transcriptional regulator n=1 Tax=Sneathiella chungangensis TaxID=1418234 RepID=A0A845MGD0_9PROT|nr:helix-turn-helix domain-containing protein [Sneathiella chungangensis]MZR22715.1 transcriptional regulator [Sneathiella chungangensis]
MTTQYGQFCPIAKATEILGEKWTLLIVRELLMGGTRFNDLQRGLTTISPTILSKRLATLDEYGLIYRRRIDGQRGFEYFPTEACQQLKPILLALGSWGMHWSRNYLTANDYDVELLMLYLERSVQPEKLPGSKAVIRFKFSDFEGISNWWIVVNGTDAVDVCTTDPGKDVDVYITTSVRTMVDAWMGRLTYQQAIASGDFDVLGPAALTRNIKVWLAQSVFVDIPSPSEILGISASNLL